MLARVGLGRRVISRFEEMVRNRAPRSFFAMDRDTGARLCALYDYDHAPTADPSDRSFDALLATYTTLRHLEAIEAGGEAAAGTLGIGVLHHPLQGRRYSLILIEDDSPSLPPELRASLESRFGVFNGDGIVEAASLEPG
jgi:hypothetical protein